METFKKALVLFNYVALSLILGATIGSILAANHLTIKEKLLTAELMEVCIKEGAAQEINLIRVKAICHNTLIRGGQ
jgi:hypothetical protein